MNDIESQRRMRMAACEKAEAQKILVVKAAEAEAEAKHLSGTGVVRQKRNYTSTRAHRALRAQWPQNLWTGTKLSSSSVVS